MTDLTEKWKAGQLEGGLYYAGNGKITDIGFFKKNTIEVYTLDSNIPKMLKHDAEIISKVPSYEELQALKEENARLKELLQQWHEIHKHMVKYHGYINHSEFHPTFIETEKFIDEVQDA